MSVFWTAHMFAHMPLGVVAEVLYFIAFVGGTIFRHRVSTCPTGGPQNQPLLEQPDFDKQHSLSVRHKAQLACFAKIHPWRQRVGPHVLLARCPCLGELPGTCTKKKAVSQTCRYTWALAPPIQAAVKIPARQTSALK